MFDNNYKKNFFFYYLFFLSVFIIYAVYPYFILLNGYFLENLFQHFPVQTHYQIRDKINSVFDETNFTYLFLLNSCLFVILLVLSLKLLVKLKDNVVVNNDNEKYIIFVSQILIILCLFILIKDLIEFYYFYKNQVNISGLTNPFLDREKFYRYFIGKNQTHYIVGSIFSIYCLKNGKLFLPIIFLLSVFIIEVASLSRFYIFLIFSCIIIISKKKFLPYLFFAIFLILFYRYFLLSSFSLKSFLSQFSFEPVSLVTNEIVKIANAKIELNQLNIFNDLIVKNFFSNFLFFDYSNTYYIFDDKHITHFKSFSQYGLLDFLAYPLQIIFLLLLIYFFRKLLIKFYDFKDLYLITNVFCIFMIVRGSAIYGLSFFVKMQIIFLILCIITFFIKKFNILKI